MENKTGVIIALIVLIASIVIFGLIYGEVLPISNKYGKTAIYIIIAFLVPLSFGYIGLVWIDVSSRSHQVTNKSD